MIDTLVLFSTHVINATVIRHFEHLRREASETCDVCLFFDEERLQLDEVRAFHDGLILEHGSTYWERFKRGGKYFSSKIPGNEDGLFFGAWDRFPGYKWYWYIEYDVAYTGAWSDFFWEFSHSKADLLATSIRRRVDIPQWQLWKSLEVPVGCFTPPEADQLRAFFVVSRFSDRLFSSLKDEYSKGWAGHSEALLPTLACRHGLLIEDIGGDGEFVPEGRSNKFYKNTPESDHLGPGTLIFRPPASSPGDQPNTLYHPVKHEGSTNWDSQSGSNDRGSSIAKKLSNILRLK